MDTLLGSIPPQVLSVSEVNGQARQLLERSFPRIAVWGEMSNLKDVSGHRYFTLKDESAQLAAVLFRREANGLRFALENGMQVIATGRLTIYAPYGRYQMVVDRLEPRGAGALQAAFEELKRALAAEGLFDQARKRPLPRLAGRVAVVTSPTGAVIRDIVNVATRRFPNVQIVLVPTRVQGAESAPAIAAAIERASRLAPTLGLTTLIVARGGGSLEDLWGFNEAVVARAIAGSAIPVVSAVGHETDFTIADFVADVRAPTPSAAAELVFPLKSELVADLGRTLDRARRALQRALREQRQQLRAARAKIGDVRWLVGEPLQRLGLLQSRVEELSRRHVTRRRLLLATLEGQLARSHPRSRLGAIRGALTASEGRMTLLMRQRLTRSRDRLQALGRHLDALSPLEVLDRGYSIVLRPNGMALRDAAEVAPGDVLAIQPARGHVEAVVRALDHEVKF